MKQTRVLIGLGGAATLIGVSLKINHWAHGASFLFFGLLTLTTGLLLVLMKKRRAKKFGGI